MKKLMIAACVVTLAVVANAASCSWAVTTESTAPDGGVIDDGRATLYGFILTKGQYDDYLAKGAEGISAAVWADYGASLAMADYSVDYEMDEATFTEGTYGKGDTSYMATIFAYKDEEDNVTHYVGNAGAKEFTADVNQLVGEMNTVAFGFESGTRETPNLSWSAAAVPEPTSGLLLLLGVAGLALRRRRA